MEETGEVAIYFIQLADASLGPFLSSSPIPTVMTLLERCGFKVIVENWTAK